MISQQDLPAYIEEAIPELSGMCKKEKCKNAYDIARQMLRYTSTQIMNHNIKAAKECLALSEKLYQKGNKAIKNAIENVFVYSFSHAFFHDENKKEEVIPLMPSSLYELYKRQVLNSHL
jgi:hypothetical protein